MMFGGIIDIFLDLATFFISGLGKVSIKIPDAVFSTLEDVFTGFGNIVPVNALLPILYVSFVISGVSITWSIFLRLKSFVPTWGN